MFKYFFIFNNNIGNNFPFKGTVSPGFRPPVFIIKELSLGPRIHLLEHFELNFKFSEIFAIVNFVVFVVKVHQKVEERRIFPLHFTMESTILFHDNK